MSEAMTEQSDTQGSAARHRAAVTSYYGKFESRIGYSLILGDTKHFGYYRPGDAPWPFGPAMRRMEDLLGERLGLARGSRVLDAGAGVGDVASRLAQAWGLDVTGIDILPFSIIEAAKRISKRRLTDRVRVVEMDYTELKFPDDSFDGAYTMETLVHSDRVEQVLAGLHRVLAPGGRLVLFEYARLPAAETTPAEEAVLTQVNQLGAMPGFQRFEHGVLEQLLLDAGFVDVEVQDVTDQMMPMLRAIVTLFRPVYEVNRLRGRPASWINGMSAVELYRHRRIWRYQVYSCSKRPQGLRPPQVTIS